MNFIKDIFSFILNNKTLETGISKDCEPVDVEQPKEELVVSKSKYVPYPDEKKKEWYEETYYNKKDFNDGFNSW